MGDWVADNRDISTGLSCSKRLRACGEGEEENEDEMGFSEVDKLELVQGQQDTSKIVIRLTQTKLVDSGGERCGKHGRTLIVDLPIIFAIKTTYVLAIFFSEILH